MTACVAAVACRPAWLSCSVMDADKLKELTDLIDEVAADAEAARGLPDDGLPLPPHVKVSRPNRPPDA